MKKINKLSSLFLILVLLLNMLFPIVSNAEESVVSITFKDQKVYQAILRDLDGKVQSKEDSTSTIKITQSNLDSVTAIRLNVEGTIKIEGIEKFENLNQLIISQALINNKVSNDSIIEDITIIYSTKVTNLSIFGKRIANFSDIKNLHKLKILSLEGCEISNNELEHISKLTNLEDLDLGLNIGNNITDIKSLETLINLKKLYLGYNKITDLEPVKALTNLNTLYLPNNEIINIEPIKYLTKLDDLTLRRNKITDISPLEQLTNLRRLNLKDNDIKNLKSIENLNLLESLDVENCNITDITPLEGMTNLYNLDLKNNKIEDISAAVKSSNLLGLYLGGNKISNLEPLTKLKLDRLETLGLENNKIDDFSVLDNMDLKDIKVNVYEQKLKAIIKNVNTVKLPNIFIQAKDPNSVAYIDENLIFRNCRLSEDGKHVIVDDNVTTAKVFIDKIIAKGGIHSSVFEIQVEDTISPNLEIKYSTKELTKDAVEVTITANEKIKQVEGWSLNDEGKVLSKLYNNNIQDKIKVCDLYGNETEAIIDISNIDNIILGAEINYSTTKKTNQNVRVTINAHKKLKEIDGWILSKDRQVLTKEYEKNAQENVKIYDLVGNEKIFSIVIDNIDKIAPNTEIKYSTKELTNSKVEVTISANEEIKEIEGWNISSNQKNLVKEYDENVKKEDIIIYDLAGNSTKNEVIITNIDKEAPKLEISYKEIENNKKVEVKIKANEKIKPIDRWQLSEDQSELTKEYVDNVNEEVIIYDLAGNYQKQRIVIDKQIQTNTPKLDNTLAPTILPKAGEKIIVISIIAILLILSIILGIKINKVKDIK